MPLTLMVFLSFISKICLCMNIEIIILTSAVGKTVIEGLKMIRMAVCIHWLQCGLLDQIYNFVEKGLLLAALREFLVVKRKYV